ncbi:eukaryotic translation initiation factor 2-alpha kinase 1-like isoform X1 [Glandiceps talaboti]
MFGKKTLTKLERKVPQTLKTFDDSDLTERQSSVSSESKQPKERHRGRRIQRLDLAKRTVPDHLLVVSLLEQLCTLYESEPNRSYQLFRIICQQLTAMKILPQVYHLEEFSSVRAQYKTALTNLMTAAVATLPKEPRHLALPSTRQERAALLLQSSSLVPRHVQMRKEEFFKAFTSRYHEEFIELGTLGKGGFGSVYKVRNKLDGREYAVKKIRLKDNNPDVCLKILREVKLLASMRHEHIVGYNSAWLETVAPKMNNMLSYHSVPAIEMKQDSYSSSNDIIFTNDSHPNIQGPTVELYHRHSSHGVHLREQHAFANPHSGNSTDFFETPQNSPKVSHRSVKIKDYDDGESVETPVNSPKQTSYIGTVTSTRVQNQSTEVDIQTTSITSNRNSKVVHTENSISTYFEKVVHFQDSNEKVALHTKDRNANSEMKISNYKNDTEKLTLDEFSSSSDVHIHDDYEDSSDEGDDFDIIDLSLSESAKGFSNSGSFTANYSGRVLHRSSSVEPGFTLPHDNPKYENYCSDGGRSFEGRGGLFNFQCGIMLFIQMQLCSHTLRQWIAERNSSTPQSVSDPFSVVSECKNMKIFKELLEGVHYIHEQGLIHRDLKPRNVFLEMEAGDYCVRIGDFGLAREDVIDSETPLTPLHTGFSSQDTNHTSGVGTHTYASPEQQQGSFYDNKSDMFSLGIILFEMFHPFGTEMERAKWMSTVRDGIIPEIIKEKWPLQHNMIQRLLSKQSTERPSALEVLNSELYTSKDDIIAKLENKISEQEQELNKLRILLKEKDEHIKMMYRLSDK